MQLAYQAMYDAYGRIFRRCGLEFRPVEADTGAGDRLDRRARRAESRQQAAPGDRPDGAIAACRAGVLAYPANTPNQPVNTPQATVLTWTNQVGIFQLK